MWVKYKSRWQGLGRRWLPCKQGEPEWYQNSIISLFLIGPSLALQTSSFLVSWFWPQRVIGALECNDSPSPQYDPARCYLVSRYISPSAGLNRDGAISATTFMLSPPLCASCITGEANTAMNTDLYNCTFPELIEDWRKAFHEGSAGQTQRSFAFGFVQVTWQWHEKECKSAGLVILAGPHVAL